MADINISDELAVKIKNDPFPNHLGAEIIKLSPGFARVSLKVQEHMTNIHRITHGGVVFTLADIALGMASNARGQDAVAVNANINFIRASKPGDVLVATAEEVHLGRRTANYRITIETDGGKLIAIAQGLVFRESK
ncbi:PaaI family thioesterase [Desulfoscipio sp. XC116]|uniref:PaaI family thioesterase n=1 Tax=Desulfoscipio sp. XC116 TaxID=3144975 RepID=UPI00325C1A03